jgi:hypothetical protein
MIAQILELLKTDDYFNVSEIVDIAKGKHEYTSNLKKIYKQKKRHYNGRKKNDWVRNSGQ